MQTANMQIPRTPNDLAIINSNFDGPTHIGTEEETVRHLLSKKHVTTKQKMIRKLKSEAHILHLKEELCDLRTKLKTFIVSKQQNYEGNCGSSCQFTCPICLQMFLTPCPTSCGHMFCYRCIDESIIRRSSCPSCRSNIRNEQFVESKPFSKISDLQKSKIFSFWSTSKEKQLYDDKRLKNQEWMKGRKINIESVKIEDLIDARDTEFIWCKAKVMNIFRTNGKIEFLVHFLGWNEIYDEIISSNSQRLAPFKFFSQRDDIPKYRVNPEESNMRSRIDYPESSSESDNNNQIIAFENNRLNVRRNHFQLLNPGRRPLIDQFIARRRNFPDFSLFNGVQNYFINLRQHRESSSSNDPQENNNSQSQRSNENDRAEEIQVQQEGQIELDQYDDGIDEDEEFEIEISNSNMNDSANLQASNDQQANGERSSNQSAIINALYRSSQSQQSQSPQLQVEQANQREPSQADPQSSSQYQFRSPSREE